MIIEDTEDPAISCPANVITHTLVNNCEATVNYLTPVGTDNCPLPITVQSAGIASGQAFPLDTTNNVFIVTDVSGNKDTCDFNVVVVDTFAPNAVCKGDTAKVLDSNAEATFTVAELDSSSSDSCGIDLMTVSPSFFNHDSLGPNKVTFQVIAALVQQH